MPDDTTPKFIQTVNYVNPEIAMILADNGMGDEKYYRGQQLWKLYEDFLAKVRSSADGDFRDLENRKQEVMNTLRLGIEASAEKSVNEADIDGLMWVPGVSREAAIKLCRSEFNKCSKFKTTETEWTHFKSAGKYDVVYAKVDLGASDAREVWGAILSILARMHEGDEDDPGYGTQRPP